MGACHLLVGFAAPFLIVLALYGVCFACYWRLWSGLGSASPPPGSNPHGANERGIGVQAALGSLAGILTAAAIFAPLLTFLASSESAFLASQGAYPLALVVAAILCSLVSAAAAVTGLGLTFTTVSTRNPVWARSVALTAMTAYYWLLAAVVLAIVALVWSAVERLKEPTAPPARIVVIDPDAPGISI